MILKGHTEKDEGGKSTHDGVLLEICLHAGEWVSCAEGFEEQHAS